MKVVNFEKKTGGIAQIYVWEADLEKVKIFLEERGYNNIKITEWKIFKWLFYAYIKDSHRRYKKWWNWGGK